MLHYEGHRKLFEKRRTQNQWCGVIRKPKNQWCGVIRKPTLTKKVVSRKSWLRQLAESILSYLKEYCACSTLHGFRYLSEERRSWFERLFWATAIGVCAFGCSRMILEMKEKLDTSNVIVMQAERPTSVRQIPFPAVTVCPVTKTRLTYFNFQTLLQLMFPDSTSPIKNTPWGDFKEWIRRYGAKMSDRQNGISEKFWNNNDTYEGTQQMREDVFWKIWVLLGVCGGVSFSDWGTNGNGTLDESAMEFLLWVAPELDSGQYFPNNFVVWDHKNDTFSSHFKHVWTEKGLCFTFNMMDNEYIYNDRVINHNVFKKKGLDKAFPKNSNDWDPDEGFSEISKMETYPWRGPMEIKYQELKILLMENLLERVDCSGENVTGYTIMLHHPQEHPQPLLNRVIYVPHDRRFTILIKVDVTTTSRELVYYNPHKRQCYFAHERHLQYFKFYSQNNCELECLTNATLDLCGCVAFYMPRYNTTKICGWDSIGCMADAYHLRKRQDLDASLKTLSERRESPFEASFVTSECDCLPSCLSVSYDADVRPSKLGLDSFYSKWEIEHYFELNRIPVAVSEVIVKFKREIFTAGQRKEMFSKAYFLSACGGFLGLFCGFSILSLVEVAYFLTVRLGTNLYRLWELRAEEWEENSPAGLEQIFARNATLGHQPGVLLNQGIHRLADADVKSQGLFWIP